VSLKRPSGRLAAAGFAGNRSISRGAAVTMTGSCRSEKSFRTRELGVVTKVKSMGMPWTMPAGWLNRLPGAVGRTLDVLSEDRLMNGMNKLTALAYRQGEESPPRRGSEHPDRWRCCVRRCKDGLHEPAKRTKICTKRARSALGQIHESLFHKPKCFIDKHLQTPSSD